MSRSVERRIGPQGALRVAAGLIGAALWAPPAAGVIVVSGTPKPPVQAEPNAQKAPAGAAPKSSPSGAAAAAPKPGASGAAIAAPKSSPNGAAAAAPKPGASGTAIAAPKSSAVGTATGAPKAATAAVAASGAASGAAPARADDAARAPARAPSFSVGDRWEFVRTADLRPDRVGSSSAFTVAAVSTGAITHANGFRQTAALASLNEVVDGKVRRVFRPFGLSLRFPLTVGKTWTEAFESVDAAPGPSAKAPAPVRIRASGRVAAVERVTVPAGTFDAYRVEHTWRAEWAGGGVEDGRRTVWYVPEVKYWVRLERETTRDAGRPDQRHTLELRSHSVASY